MSDIIVSIDIDKMTIGDLELLERAGRNELDVSDLIDFLDRVTAEDVRSLPIVALGQIVQQLNDEVSIAANPQTDEGN